MVIRDKLTRQSDTSRAAQDWPISIALRRAALALRQSIPLSAQQLHIALITLCIFCILALLSIISSRFLTPPAPPQPSAPQPAQSALDITVPAPPTLDHFGGLDSLALADNSFPQEVPASAAQLVFTPLWDLPASPPAPIPEPASLTLLFTGALLLLLRRHR